MLKKIFEIKKNYGIGRQVSEDSNFTAVKQLSAFEETKKPYRFDVINYLLSRSTAPTYLEIGVRNPALNFNKIKSKTKYSVDPGIEFIENPVDFKITSDVFFDQLKKGQILQSSIKFDVIFIDGLHLAEQADRDIQNALHFIKDDGFIVLHDCNPPSEYHSREDHNFRWSPAMNDWNGTVWKAFFKMRTVKNVSCCCIDSDWGIGIITKNKLFATLETNFNPFFEYSIFANKRSESLNLMSFEQFCKSLAAFKPEAFKKD